jgi:hypothetical protein
MAMAFVTVRSLLNQGRPSRLDPLASRVGSRYGKGLFGLCPEGCLGTVYS